MRSIQGRVVPSLPRLMGIASGVTLILVGLLGPAWITTPAALEASVSTARHAPGPNVLLPGQPAEIIPPTGRLALTPPMGWNGFNRFYHSITQATVEAQARALVASGMQAAGYTYVNLDGGWDLMHRDALGNLRPDPAKFPHGIKPVADYVHSLGFKFGIYASAGTMNCAATSAGSYGNYGRDAAQFASWGVDYVKLDWCYIPYRSYPGMSREVVSQLLATQMANALAATKRSMVYDINDWSGSDTPWVWARGLAHMWRTTRDSNDRYTSMVSQFVRNVAFNQYAGPGGWNDPDMLEIGNGGMTPTEYQSEFSLWAEMAAPLIAGNDLTHMSRVTRSILTNQAVIAVDQDPLGRQGYVVSSVGGRWVLTKPLVDGDRAVVLFNETGQPARIASTADALGLLDAPLYALFNVWDGSVADSSGDITAVVPPHGSVMFVVSALRQPGP